MNPVEYVIHQFGGVRKLARSIDRSPSSVSIWRTGLRRNTNDGNIPSRAMADIMKAAKKLGLDITERDLIYGRTIKTKEGESNGKSKSSKKKV
jgi:hypothetical protein